MKRRMRAVVVMLTCALLVGTPDVPVLAAEGTTDFCVKIVHTNDIHARVEENESSGIIGLPKLKSFIDSYTEGADMDLVLDSGDLFHGQSIATLVQGESIAKLVKACGYDAMTAGNHDWNYGKDRLKELVDLADIEMLAGNVINEDGNKFFDTPYYCETVTKDGQELKVGIFGEIDTALYSSTSLVNVEGLTFNDTVAYAGEAVAELEDMGCDIVIGLAHTYDPVSLASKVDGVDLWLAGHEHMDIDREVKTPDGSSSYVVENGYYLYEAGMIDIDCSLNAGGEVVDIDISTEKADYTTAGKLEENAEVRAVLDDINKDQSVILNQVVGTSTDDLDGDWYSLRIDETNMGRAMTDAYLLETGADIALENAGGIRSSVSKGDVTYGDIIGVSPFGNYIVTKQINGKELREILETSIDIQTKNIIANDSGEYDAWPENSGSYLQVGGITVSYNMALEYGKRVISVKVGQESLEEEKLYTVAMNNYLAISGDYPQLAQAEELGEYCACDEALIKYFSQSEEVISGSVTTPRMVKTTETNQPAQTPDAAPTETPRTPQGGVSAETPGAAATSGTAVMTPKPTQTATAAQVTKPGKVKIKSAKNKKKKSITIQLSKVKNAKKYEIQYATNKKFKKAKKKNTKKLTCSLKKLQKGKTYYIKARAINGKESGKWSKVCKVKVKK